MRRRTAMGAAALAACLLAAVTALGTAAASAAAPAPAAVALLGPPEPQNDDFYRAAVAPGGQPGDVVRSRPSPVYDNLLGLFPLDVNSWQVVYRSTSVAGAPNAVSGTVMVPKTAWTGAGPRPLVSYAVGTHGLADRCAPSFLLRNGMDLSVARIKEALAKGWAVAVTDYEGLGMPGEHTYLTHRSMGHAVLDMARAAQRLPGSGLSVTGPVATWGYSQGGAASGAAGELAASYAPGLNVVGSAEGGAPADMAASLANLDGGAPGLTMAAIAGFDAAYPEIAFRAQLNAAGKERYDRVRKQCTLELVILQGNHKMTEFTALPQPFAYPPLAARLAENRLGGTAPAAPVYLFHTTNDELIPVAIAHGLRDAYCAAGVQVTYTEIPNTDHGNGEQVGAAAAIAWMADRFAGTAAPSAC